VRKGTGRVDSPDALLAIASPGGTVCAMRASLSPSVPVLLALLLTGCEPAPLLVLGGQDYGSGSSRDWAAQ
jgi:hypothetical protein